MTHLFIINPAAGSRDRSEQYRDQIEALCKPRGLSYRIEISAAPGDCFRIARQAADSGEEYRIYACGGDGTLNEERLLDAREVTFDMIRCNEDLSLNICSVGLDARIGTDVSNYKRLPLLSGFRAYAASTVVNVIRGIAEHYVVKINGETVDAEQTMICVCNGRYYGGGFNPVPEADPTDGLLDVLLVKKVSRLQVPKIIGKYKSGRYRELKDLVRHYQTKELTILCDKPTPVNLDGELRTAQEVRMTVAQEKLRFFYPKDLTWQAAEPVCV